MCWHGICFLEEFIMRRHADMAFVFLKSLFCVDRLTWHLLSRRIYFTETCWRYIYFREEFNSWSHDNVASVFSKTYLDDVTLMNSCIWHHLHGEPGHLRHPHRWRLHSRKRQILAKIALFSWGTLVDFVSLYSLNNLINVIYSPKRVFDTGGDEFSTTSRTPNYPSSAGSKSLSLLRAGVRNVIGEGVQRFYSTRDNAYLGEYPLLSCDHPPEWVQSKSVELANFKDKGLPTPEYGPGIC